MSKKISILPHKKKIEIGGGWEGGGSKRPKHFKKCIKLNLFSVGEFGGSWKKNIFCGGGMDIFLGHIFHFLLCCIQVNQSSFS